MKRNEGQYLTESDARLEEKQRPRYHTERGFVLPPGIIPWDEYQKTQKRPMWHADHAMRTRIRGIMGSREQFVVSDDPKDVMAFERVRAEFRAETNRVVREMQRIFQETHVQVVVNGPSEKRLHAWQRELPRFTVKCFPMLFTSNVPNAWEHRMVSSPRVAECLMHFDMERRLQRVRWHSNVDAAVLARATMIGFGVDGDREKMNDAYSRQDYVAVAAMIAEHISQAILRFP